MQHPCSGPTSCLLRLVLQILKFFVHMGMPHPYKAPLLLVEAPVLDDYAHREGRRQDAAHAPMFSVRGLCVAHVYT